MRLDRRGTAYEITLGVVIFAVIVAISDANPYAMVGIVAGMVLARILIHRVSRR